MSRLDYTPSPTKAPPIARPSAELSARWNLFTPLHSSSHAFNRHNEARCRPPRGSRSCLPSLGSEVAHAAGSHCRRSVRDRTCSPPVVDAFCAARGVLLRGHKGYKGLTALKLRCYVGIMLDRHEANLTFSARSNMKSKHKRHCQQRAQRGVRAPATISKS